VLLCFTGLAALAEQRFPPPDFTETSHQIPATTAPGARAIFFQYLDVAVLAAALGMATWLVLGKRSRRWVLVLYIFSVGYFGFYRNGCVCSIGSLQNVALALGDSSYALPAAVLAFFALPLAFALFAGRVFCAGVCPHGALQDLVLLKPVKVPTWLENGLSVLPFVYLGAGVLFAATGSSFIICQYDPFIPIFRMSGRALMVLSGAGLLVLGLFVGRPFCRFLCPYGALLKIAASVAKWGVEITPDNCSKCRLCEEVCPYGAVRPPVYGQPEPAALRREARRLPVADPGRRLAGRAVQPDGGPGPSHREPGRTLCPPGGPGPQSGRASGRGPGPGTGAAESEGPHGGGGCHPGQVPAGGPAFRRVGGFGRRGETPLDLPSPPENRVRTGSRGLRGVRPLY
jgi:ferredoxin